MNTSLLQKQYDFYVANEEDLLKKYNGMHLVIDDLLHVYAFAEEEEIFDVINGNEFRNEFSRSDEAKINIKLENDII